ncbi:MAG TPA: hypothetical protein VF275_00115 [Gammaproteobacteria bacterium]
MRRMASIFLLGIGSLLLAACATGGHPALAETEEPHAVLHELLQGDIDDTHYRTTLVRIDGQAILQGERRAFLLEPGRHTFGFQLDVESMKEFESGMGRRFPDPSPSAASVNEKSVEMDLEAGEHYTFGAHIEDFNYSGWTPFVVKTEDLD